MNSKRILLIFLWLTPLNIQADPITFERQGVLITYTDLSGYTSKYFLTEPFKLTIGTLIKKGLHPIKVSIQNNSDHDICIDREKFVGEKLACFYLHDILPAHRFLDPFLIGYLLTFLVTSVSALNPKNKGKPLFFLSTYIAAISFYSALSSFDNPPSIQRLTSQLEAIFYKKLYSGKVINPGQQLETFILIRSTDYNLYVFSHLIKIEKLNSAIP